MSIYPYDVPSFLTGQSADEIHRRMLATLPSDIDKSSGSIPWDFTRPSALEKAEFVEFSLNETIKLMFPQWAYGKWLDYHAELRNVSRKSANKAFGEILVTGVLGTLIPEGFCFATTSGLTASVLFQTVGEVVLQGESDEKNQVSMSISVEAVLGGISGNVASDMVKIMATPLSGINYVTNLEAFSGGTAEESDDDLRERVLEAIALGSSYTGCVADYIRWAKEISGVGYVVVEPEWNDPSLPEVFHYTDASGKECCAGAVRVIVVDDNGNPANDQILEDVYFHICGTGATDINRLSPIGAHVTVIAPETIGINIKGELHLEDDQELETIITRIRSNLSDYWVQVATEAQASETGLSVIRYVQVGAVIAKTLGVKEYDLLLVNGKEENITVSQAEYPVTGEVSFTVY